DLLDLTSQLSAMLMQPVQAGNLVFHLEEWGQSLAQLQGAITKPLPKDALHLLETTSVGVLWFLVILVAVYLFLSEWTGLRERLFALALPPYRAEIQELYRRIRRIWMAYLRGQIVLMIIVGVVFTVTWLILGIPGALALGLIAGLFTLVPDVGPFLAAIIAASVALLEGSTWIPLPNFWVAVILLVVFFVLMTLKNLLLRPLIMGRSVHMHEGIVFIAIIAATVLEGILGALLVVPVLATVIILAGYLQRRILGLTPFENDGDTQFVAPPEKVNPPRRGSRKFRLLEKARASSAHASESPTPTGSTRGKKNNRKKTSP
ncbi:MAG TPA: AI-2E family transporter, partial [Anaerolineales bacterium]|nr:AI-2E family transporter [Anaerolineales bacterium]